MYSRRIIGKVIERFTVKNGWEPVYHTPAQVDEFNEYIDSIVEMDANSVNRYFSWKPGKRPNDRRVEWIKRWITNEKFLCFADAEYFVTRYARIRNVEERIIRVEFRKAQRIFLRMLARYDDRQIAIQMFILKARQVGISTIVAQFFLHRILFRSNTHAIMASAQVGQSEKLGMMIETTWQRLPFWLPPPKTSTKDKEPRWANGSAMSVQAGSQNVGIAQGSTPTCIHLSEIGDYTTPKKTIEEGLFPAAHQTASLFFVLEGTGSTASPWQKEKWKFYSENDARFKTLFIPPACADDIYPHEDWLKAHPVPDLWTPMLETQRMARRCELFVRSTDYLADYLGTAWEMDRRYKWYWEFGYKEAVASHSEKTYVSQNAVVPDDAFQSKWDPVFSDETIEVVTTEREKTYRAYAVTGKTILIGQDNAPYEPPAEAIDWKAERIPLRWEANDGNAYEWELIPLLSFDDASDESCFDKLLVFEEPRPGAEYAEGVDTADGLGMPNEDRFSLTVHRKGTGIHRDVQCASFTSIRVNSAQAARVAAAVAAYYTTDGYGTITSANPMGMRFIIEQIRKAGDECQLQLKLMGFYDHHIMHFYDNKGSIDPNKGTKEGWRTSKWSRPIVLNRFVSAVVTGWFKPNDPILIRQLKTFVRKEKEGMSEMTHEVGQHDDNIFSNAMCWTTNHDLDSDSERLQKQYKPPAKHIPPSQGWCTNAVALE